ncbi:deaminase [Streptomyces sp. NPDC055109]
MEIALRQASRSQCRYKVGAVLASGNRILAASSNTRRNSPLVDFRHATFHAEEAALRKAQRTSGTTIYVARISADGSAAMARPCIRCQDALTRASVRRVTYTVNPSLIQTLFLPRH